MFGIEDRDDKNTSGLVAVLILGLVEDVVLPEAEHVARKLWGHHVLDLHVVGKDRLLPGHLSSVIHAYSWFRLWGLSIGKSYSISLNIWNCGKVSFLFFKMGQPRPLFRLFSVFSNKQYNFYNKYMWKMSIQYTVPGFEPTTFGTWVSSHNH